MGVHQRRVARCSAFAGAAPNAFGVVARKSDRRGRISGEARRSRGAVAARLFAALTTGGLLGAFTVRANPKAVAVVQPFQYEEFASWMLLWLWSPRASALRSSPTITRRQICLNGLNTIVAFWPPMS